MKVKRILIYVFIVFILLTVISCYYETEILDNTASELNTVQPTTQSTSESEENYYTLAKVFNNQTIQEEIYCILGKAERITQDDFNHIESLNLENLGIDDITGLEKLTNLKELNLSWNYIEDITPIANLTNLVYLNLNDNKIIDINPLQKLYKLKTLDLRYCRMTDLDVLTNLQSLEVLKLRDCERIKDFSVLASLTSLKELQFDPYSFETSSLMHLENLEVLTVGYSEDSEYQESLFNNILDLENLETLCLCQTGYIDVALLLDFSRLKNLYIEADIIDNVGAISKLTNLEELAIRFCDYYDDISVLSNLTNLKKLYLDCNFISDISELKDLTSLIELDISCNNIKDISPLSSLLNLKVLNISGNEIEDLTPLEKLDLDELIK